MLHNPRTRKQRGNVDATTRHIRRRGAGIVLISAAGETFIHCKRMGSVSRCRRRQRRFPPQPPVEMPTSMSLANCEGLPEVGGVTYRGGGDVGGWLSATWNGNHRRRRRCRRCRRRRRRPVKRKVPMSDQSQTRSRLAGPESMTLPQTHFHFSNQFCHANRTLREYRADFDSAYHQH